MQIKLEHVFKFFNGKTVLKDLTLSAEQNERIVIFGPSGSGKSTLLRIIAGFIQPDQGKVEIDDILAAKEGQCLLAPEKRHIGMVFQDLALWPHMTVYENIAFGLRVQRLPSSEILQKTESILEKVRLTNHRYKLPGEISGGEQQRVAFARALVARPKILLMDEPLSHLDEDLRSALIGEILSLHHDFSGTLLYVTHNIKEGIALGTKFISLIDGEIKEK